MTLYLTFYIASQTEDDYLIRCSPIPYEDKDVKDTLQTYVYEWDETTDIPTTTDYLTKDNWYTGIFYNSNYGESAIFTNTKGETFIVDEDGVIIPKPDDYKEIVYTYLNGNLIEISE